MFTPKYTKPTRSRLGTPLLVLLCFFALGARATDAEKEKAEKIDKAEKIFLMALKVNTMRDKWYGLIRGEARYKGKWYPAEIIKTGTDKKYRVSFYEDRPPTEMWVKPNEFRERPQKISLTKTDLCKHCSNMRIKHMPMRPNCKECDPRELRVGDRIEVNYQDTVYPATYKGEAKGKFKSEGCDYMVTYDDEPDKEWGVLKDQIFNHRFPAKISTREDCLKTIRGIFGSMFRKECDTEYSGFIDSVGYKKTSQHRISKLMSGHIMVGVGLSTPHIKSTLGATRMSAPL